MYMIYNSVSNVIRSAFLCPRIFFKIIKEGSMAIYWYGINKREATILLYT